LNEFGVLALHLTTREHYVVLWETSQDFILVV
jgi:hypothetical protein